MFRGNQNKEEMMFRSIRISDYMTTSLITTTPDADLLSAVDLLIEHGISGMPVVQDGQLIGMVSEHDCLNGILKGTYQGEVGGRVAEVMSQQIDTIAHDTDVIAAAESFMKLGRRRLPVVDASGKLIGQLSRCDVLRAIRAYELPESA